MRAREGAPLMTEEFGFDKCFRDCGTVDVDECGISPGLGSWIARAANSLPSARGASDQTEAVGGNVQ